MRKRGYPVKLQQQHFAVLLLLVERAGQIVSREEIHQHIWGSDTFVDFDRGINFAINQIRAALGDNADKPRYIETIPRRGYRFIGRLELEPIAKQSEIPALEQTVSRKRKALRLALTFAAALVFVSLLVTLFWNWRPWASRKVVATNSRPTVAVIEIENHSQDASLNWLGDGVVDLLTTNLAQAKNIDVISSERVRDLISGKAPDSVPLKFVVWLTFS